jgi:hypothetical protein
MSSDPLYEPLAVAHEGGARQTRVARQPAAAPAGLEPRLRAAADVSAFSAILVVGYVSYRSIACNALNWECNGKDWAAHFSDVVSLLTIGGVLWATGPTIDSRTLGPSLLIFFSVCFVFGAIGQVPFMENSLSSGTDAFTGSSLYLYLSAALIIVTCLTYAGYMACKSRTDGILALLTLTMLFAVYGAAGAIYITQEVFVNLTFHLHHYFLAASLCLLFRAENDPPTLLIRWLLLGVFVEGMSAYGPAAMLIEPANAKILPV